MINVGIAGIGFMGWIHWLAYGRSERARVRAITDRDEKKLAGDWTGIQGNFGPPGEQVDLSEIAAHADLAELLKDDSIDVVDICLPPHFHGEAVKQCLAAGKHVFCEKPLAVTAEECAELVSAAQQAERLLLVGQVLPFFPEYKFARQLIADGSAGRPLGGNFKRVISDPKWLPDFYDPQRCGGPMIDLHVHDAHFIRMLFGMPQSVYSIGRMRGEVVEYCQTVFGFADRDIVVSSTCGVIHQQGRPFTHGYELHLEKATLQFEFAGFSDEGELMPLKVLRDDDSIERPDLGDGDPVNAFCDEIEEVVNSIESGTPSDVLSGELARDAIIMCHHQTASVQTGRVVEIPA